jgi:hypothetical protein
MDEARSMDEAAPMDARYGSGALGLTLFLVPLS